MQEFESLFSRPAALLLNVVLGTPGGALTEEVQLSAGKMGLFRAVYLSGVYFLVL